MQKLLSVIKQYHLHWLFLRLVVAAPFAIVHTLGEWAYTAGTWILYRLPDARKEK